MLLSKNVGILSLYPTIYFQQTTVITEIVYQTYQNDPYLNYVVLNINGDGLIAGNNNTFLDSSSANLTITRINATQGSFSPFSPASWSGYFDGNSYLTIPTNAAFAFGTGNFTVECYVYITDASKPYPTILEIGDHSNVNSLAFWIQDGANNLVPKIWSNAAVNAANTPQLSKNTWNHIVWQRTNGNLKIYVNGVGSSTVSFTNNLTTTTNISIGYAAGYGGPLTNYAYVGHISNIRIIKGQSLYTSNFIPPIDNLTVLSGAGFGTSLLTLQNNIFKDNSPNNFTLSVGTGTPIAQPLNPFKKTTAYSPTAHGGSGYFDGTSYLDIPSNAGLAFPNGTNFTIECWINFSNFTGNRFYSTNSLGAILYFQNGVPVFGTYGGSDILIASVTLEANRWYHVAVTRSGTVLRMFIDGVQMDIQNNDTTSYAQAAVRIGGDFGTGPAKTTGYASNLRVVKGRAVYTSNFTPPTSPVAINDASLLLNFNNGNVIDSSGSNVITTVGDARTDVLNTAPLSSSTGSLYFDGTGDYLRIPSPAGSPTDISLGDFTIEFWVNYPTAPTGYTGMIARNFPGADFRGLTIITETGVNGGIIHCYISSTGTGWNVAGINTGIKPIANKWHHIALTRDSSGFKIWIDGINRGSATVANTTAIYNTTQEWNIGSYSNFPTSGRISMTGYIDDLRITRGVARYTNNFPLQTYENPTYDISSSTISISSLLVGGGGAGGYQYSGGGGAGGVLLSSVTVPLTGTYNITIGAGGTAGTTPAATDKATVQNGKNTLFYNLTAYGGGAGADDSTNNAQNGGSGGGAWYNGSVAGYSLFGQGFSGGRAPSNTNFAGGGGGSGEAGDTDGEGTGGDGLSSYSNILTIVSAGVLAPDGLRYIAGGGSGWARSGSVAAGLGGGGTGFGADASGAGTSGIVNTGGGGGGSGVGSAAGGGSGIVILQTSDDVLGNVITTNASKVFNNNRIYYKYTSNGTITTTPNTYTTVYIIGGGGGGAATLINNGCGGGGGAGGTIISPMYLQGGSYTITIGNGGAGGASGAANDGTNGSNTSFGTGVSGLTAFGGGGGGSSTNVTGRSGKAGGCGGGGGYFNGTGGAATAYTSLSVITTNTNSQGFSGANGRNAENQPYNGGGGGGAGQSGNSFTGGSGIGLNLVGFMEYYAGGGSGGVETGTASGGLGGGGAGGIGAGSAGTAGTAYTGGGGGGGGGAASGTGGAGGSGGGGIVIIKQPINQSRYFTTGSGVLTGIYNNFMIYKFFSSGTLTVPTLEYYVVGGGGGGGAVHGGGGGAGSVIWGSMFDRNLTVGTYSIIIGSGGSGGTGGSTYFDGNNGGNTAFGSITALGGGGGGKGFTSASLYGKSGGSGGGGGAATLGNTGTGSALSGFGDVSTLSAFVNLGGVGKGGATGSAKAGGGGGAGAGGTSGSTTGNGGAGINIFGLGFFAGGGGGGSDQAGDSTGGSNVGGNGSANAAGTAGAVNTGSGGGGGGGNFSAGGAGGSGAVLISVVTATNPIKSWTGNPVITTSGSNTIYRFNNNGTITI